MFPRLLWLAPFLLCSFAAAQTPEFDFYPEFRNVFTPDARAKSPTATNETIAELYAEKLRDEGVAREEIERRKNLVLNERHALEADYWSRFYADPDSEFNRAPNAFLMQAVADRKPGAALDYAMGEGRNSIYLAQLGWQVWGFDPAGAAIAMAQDRARALGLSLQAEAVRDSDYDFGEERFDLILFSWSMPLVPIERVVDSLKPGGIVVMEVAADFVGHNGMLKMFEALKITRYEIVQDKADFYARRETEILRMIAVKP